MTDQVPLTDDEPRVCASCRNHVRSPQDPRPILAFCRRELCRQRSLVWDRMLADSLREPSTLQGLGMLFELMVHNTALQSVSVRSRTRWLVGQAQGVETELARISRLIQEHGSGDLSRLTDSRGKLLKQRRQHEHDLATIVRHGSGTPTGRVARDLHHWKDWKDRSFGNTEEAVCVIL